MSPLADLGCRHDTGRAAPIQFVNEGLAAAQAAL